MSILVLGFLNFSFLFIVEIDVSYDGLGVVLS